MSVETRLDDLTSHLTESLGTPSARASAVRRRRASW